jgi:hypothetical protein
VLAQAPVPGNRYRAGCVYALTSKSNPEDQARAFRLLEDALRGGFGVSLVASDTDLDPLRSHPEFQRLVEFARRLAPPPAK